VCVETEALLAGYCTDSKDPVCMCVCVYVCMKICVGEGGVRVDVCVCVCEGMCGFVGVETEAALGG